MILNTKYKIYLVNLGCPKNQVDAEIMLGKLQKDCYEFVSSYKQADIVIINTCGFIDAAKKESTDTILEYASHWKKKAKDKFLIVTGCLVGRYKDKLAELLPEVDGWLCPGEIDKIDFLINSILKTREKKVIFSTEYLSYLPNANDRNIKNILFSYFSAYIKIADGCDNRCSYCVIPYIRGHYRSRTIESIVEEVKVLVRNGIKEINLIAQDITNYGIDIYGKRYLTQLLKRLLKIKDLQWIRLLYVYPEHIMPELIELFKHEDKICKYLDIPIQHIDDKILKLMKRQSTEKSIKKIIENLKNNISEIALRTSLIVGFPGETENQFKKLSAWIKDVEFDYLGVFTYSREQGTEAYSMPIQLSKKIKEERQAELLKIQSNIIHSKNMNRIGNPYTILVEGKTNNNFKGRTKFQAPEIDGEVIVERGKALPGEFITVKITNAIEYDLYGEVG